MARRTSAYPQLLTIKEKHSDSTYLVNSIEEVHRVATAIVRERAKLGYYYETDVEKLKLDRERAVDKLIEKAGFATDTAPRTAEALSELTGTEVERAAKLLGVEPAALEAYPEKIRAQVIAATALYEKSLPRVLASHSQEIQDAENILRLVGTEKAEELTIDHRGRSHNLALWILEGRRDYEYEGFDFEYPETVPTAEDLEASRSK